MICELSSLYALLPFLGAVSGIATAGVQDFTEQQIGVGIPSCTGNLTTTNGEKFIACFPGNVGCFDYVFIPPHTPLPPKCPTDVCTVFHFYTARNPDTSRDIQVYPEIYYNDADFEPSRTTFCIIHGFTDDGTLAWIRNMTHALLKRYPDSQVIVPEWGKGAVGPSFPQALGNARVVARLLQLFIVDAIEKSGAGIFDFVIIAHSLGAHIAGYTAKYLKQHQHLIPPVAILLDPDLPLFEPTPPSARVAIGDFDYQMAYHTSSFVYPIPEGYQARIANADVYFNGGGEQPGCEPNENDELTRPEPIGDFTTDLLTISSICAHQRPQQYLTESIQDDSCKFLGHRVNLPNASTGLEIMLGLPNPPLKQCTPKSCVFIGLESLKRKPDGIFVVETNGPTMFCKKDEYDKYLRHNSKFLMRHRSTHKSRD